MINQSTRSKVLKILKQLHRTQQQVFQGDKEALAAARIKINTEFKINQAETDEGKILKFLKMGEDAELLLRKSVVQAVIKDKNTYEMRFTAETNLEKNTPFDPHANLPVHKKKKNVPPNQRDV